jgi:hypothetical protein
MTLVQIGVLALVTLVLALTVVRPILNRPPPAVARIGGIAGLVPIAGDPLNAGALPLLSQSGFPAPEGRTDRPATDAEALRLAVAGQPEQTVTMLRDWLTPVDFAGGEVEVAR